MNKAILVIDMPNCCYECFAFDDNGDHAMCLVTEEIRGYRFKPREQKMDKCPLKSIPDKLEGYNSIYYQFGEYEDGWNHCIECLIDT